MDHIPLWEGKYPSYTPADILQKWDIICYSYSMGPGDQITTKLNFFTIQDSGKHQLAQGLNSFHATILLDSICIRHENSKLRPLCAPT